MYVVKENLKQAQYLHLTFRAITSALVTRTINTKCVSSATSKSLNLMRYDLWWLISIRQNTASSIPSQQNGRPQILKNPLGLEHTFHNSFDVFLSDILLVIVERFNNMPQDCDFMMLKIYVLSSPCAIYINYSRARKMWNNRFCKVLQIL